MKIEIKKLISTEAITKIKRCGYAQIKDSRTGQTSFVRRLGGYFYPRFHVYLEEDNGGQLFYTIHLDQKKPSYQGTTAHSGEYDSEVVKQEVERIKGLLV
jgi:hypothetical protein